VGEQAYILQQPDGRIVFVIPYEQQFTLIGTTDVRVGMADLSYAMTPSEDEINYILAAANRYLTKPVQRADIIHTYAGVRPLYDDGSPNPSETTRDYTLVLQQNWLDIFGGKITTYRYLAQEALERLRPALPLMGAPWSETQPLPGGDLSGFSSFDGFFDHLVQKHPLLPQDWLKSAARRHGSNLQAWLGNAQTLAELGADLGGGLMQAEADYLQTHEWAVSLDDMLWRRTKCGLHAKAQERANVQVFAVQH
jgi:glycerol-3-phosphate dehydrogenase